MGGNYSIGLQVRITQFGWLLLPALLALAGCGRTSGNPAKPGEAGQPASRFNASKAAPHVNGLGMKFVPVPRTRVLFCIWETRNQDYLAWASALGIASPAIPSLQQKPAHPAANVSWEEAVAFCQWLTEKERKAGSLGPQDRYRLPTDKEWDAAVGPDRFPWGNKWPKQADRKSLPGHKPGDNDDNLAVVGSHAPNEHGLHDLGSNVFEWCLDWYRADMNNSEIRTMDKRLTEDGNGRKFKVLRGASWIFWDPVNLLSSYRYPSLPDTHGALYGFRCVLEPGGK
jgi:formylglycine-generating enzyme required for sulfatase activity